MKTGPTAEHSGPSDLPEDVVREIIKYLTDGEALKMSTLSKSFHATFPPRPMDVTCTSHRKAASLRKRLVQSTNGAAHLVSLELRCTSLTATDVSIIRDILAKAQNLRNLALGRLEFGYLDVRTQIRSLSHLSRLQIHEPSKSDLNAMVFPPSLSSLRLIGLNEGVSWSDLGRKLSSVTRLTELILERFPLEDPGLERDLDVDGADAPTPLPSVTSLEALSTDLPFDLSYFARMFPSLETLRLEDSTFSMEDGRYPEDTNRVLHKVTYVGSADEPIPWEVRHLAAPVRENNRLHLDSVCMTEMLVGLRIRLPTFTLDHWNKRIEPFITDVHILELEAFKADFPKTIRTLVSSSFPGYGQAVCSPIAIYRQIHLLNTILDCTGTTPCKFCLSRPLKQSAVPETSPWRRASVQSSSSTLPMASPTSDTSRLRALHIFHRPSTTSAGIARHGGGGASSGVVRTSSSGRSPHGRAKESGSTFATRTETRLNDSMVRRPSLLDAHTCLTLFLHTEEFNALR